MKREANFRLMASAGLTLLAASIGLSQPLRAADGWPTRDITFYVPYAPGGSTDPISRKYAELIAGFIARRQAAFAEAMAQESSLQDPRAAMAGLGPAMYDEPELKCPASGDVRAIVS
jgi:hypothetical protein